MSLIRYHNQTPTAVLWPSLDRWANLQNEINTLLELPSWPDAHHRANPGNGWTPALDLYQNDDAVVAVIELPGMRKEEIEISLNDGLLAISGERKEEAADGEKALRTERSSGKFRRRISIPSRVDMSNVSASYKDGILTVTLPKAEEAKPKQIQIKTD